MFNFVNEQRGLVVLALFSISLSSSAFAFDAGYKSTNTATGTVGNKQTLRFPFSECELLGLDDKNMDNCLTVSFPTESDSFFSVFGADEKYNKPDFNDLLKSGSYNNLTSKYVDKYYSQLNYSWNVPTEAQFKSLRHLAISGKLYQSSKNDYKSGRFLVASNGGFKVLTEGQGQGDVKLPNLVSNEFNGKASTKKTSCNDISGACLSVIKTTFGKWFTNTPSKAFMDTKLRFSLNRSASGVQPKQKAYWPQFVAKNSSSSICNDYNKINVEGRSNWRLPKKQELVQLAKSYSQEMKDKKWPLSDSYWTSDIGYTGNSSFKSLSGIVVDLSNGNVKNKSATTLNFVSCVSETP